jgi:Transcriptional regulator, AbiEi antitoxin
VTPRDFTDTLSKVDVGTPAIWRAAGISTRQLHSLVSSGQLVKVRHGAYATRGVLSRAETDPGLRHAVDVAATVATRRHSATASHHSAAQLHGLRVLKQPPGGTVTLTVPPGTRAGRYRQDVGVICHAAQLPDQQVTKRYGVAVTTAARTVADIARTTTFMEGVVVADAALYERHASKSELRRVLAGCERWPGTCRARQVIDFADGLAESVLESCAGRQPASKRGRWPIDHTLWWTMSHRPRSLPRAGHRRAPPGPAAAGGGLRGRPRHLAGTVQRRGAGRRAYPGGFQARRAPRVCPVRQEWRDFRPNPGVRVGVLARIGYSSLRAPERSGASADVAQLVEHHLAKVRVAGSNPVVRSEARLCGSG